MLMATIPMTSEERRAYFTALGRAGRVHVSRDDEGTILAGVYGWTWGRFCEIESLWVRSDHRRSGLGTRRPEADAGEALLV